MYNLNKIYPEYDRYAFSNEIKRWMKERFKTKITSITEDYSFHPDIKRIQSIEEIDKPKRNHMKDKKTIQEEEMRYQILELKEMTYEEIEAANLNDIYRDIKMAEDRLMHELETNQINSND